MPPVQVSISQVHPGLKLQISSEDGLGLCVSSYIVVNQEQLYEAISALAKVGGIVIAPATAS